MTNAAIHTFTSHIAGKNAVVSIYTDRVEWTRPRGVSAGKLTAGLMTGGASLLLTGVKNGKTGTEMIPVKTISSITTKRDGLLNTLVQVITSGNTIDFRISHAEAVIVKQVLTDLMLGKHPSQVVVEAAAAAPIETPAPTVPDSVEQLKQLAALRDSGILSEDEFTAKKAELLARL